MNWNLDFKIQTFKAEILINYCCEKNVTDSMRVIRVSSMKNYVFSMISAGKASTDLNVFDQSVVSDDRTVVPCEYKCHQTPVKDLKHEGGGGEMVLLMKSVCRNTCACSALKPISVKQF